MLEFRPGAFGGVNAINAVSLEDYVAGVVSRESPSSWPLEALKAQAVAARTYAITTSKAGAGFEQYADTRSQVYGGVGGRDGVDEPAVAATRGQVVTYDGAPVVTYFFSTSGGRTENVENTNVGGEPQPWLKSVEDPVRRRLAQAPLGRRSGCAWASAAAQAVRARQGPLQGRPGASSAARSPRIVAADVVGTARPHARERRDAARPPRPARHVGLLHLDRHQEEAAGGGDPDRAAAAARGRRGHRRRDPERADDALPRDRLRGRHRPPRPRRRSRADPGPARRRSGST